MKSRVYSLLNIKPSEAGIVKQLFLVQFFLGVATSFLFTSALTLFLATYPIKELPKVLLLAAGLLLAANYAYARLEAKLSAKRVLQAIILFSLGSIVFTWLEATFFSITWLPFFLSAWNMVVYMVIGYAFWGMAAIIFNVRESKRIFSVVGSGDIPAKIIGYAAVAILAPVIGVINVLAISIVAFLAALYYLRQFEHPAIIAAPGHGHHSTSHNYHSPVKHPGLVERLFENNLIFVIAGWSFLGFTIYSLLDYTFLTEIKAKYKTSHELASFLGIYFAVGRVLAMFIKLLFSSRVINRLGLTNSLLITPVILLFLTAYILLTNNNSNDGLLLFGIMVLLSEVLKSAVQEPAFFVLFQPLHPHARLKGHLITKGYTLPFALLAVGIFAFTFRDTRGEVSIALVCRTLILLLVVWSAVVFLIKKEYLHTLIQALKKGYFTGTQLFLTDQPVRDLLLEKTESSKPKEVLFGLKLLERSGYKQLDQVLLRELHSTSVLVKKYVLSRIIHRNIKAALPVVRQQLAAGASPYIIPDLMQALFYLIPDPAREQTTLETLEPVSKKAALLGLAARSEPTVWLFVQQEVTLLRSSPTEEDKLLALEIISAAPHINFDTVLNSLLQDPGPAIYKKAIETVGQTRAYKLWSQMLATAQQHKATGALQKAILHFGDAIYDPEHVSGHVTSPLFTSLLVKTAGSITGNLSTNYLLEFLRASNSFKDMALAALFHKKADLIEADKKQVILWLEVKLEQGKRKINIFQELSSHSAATLLADAVKSEINQDLELILQACALSFNRSRLERVLQLLKSSGDSRISNAIELLELHIPKRYFLQIDTILEFTLETNMPKHVPANSNQTELALILKEIITAPATYFNVWTKSVALYLIPTLPGTNLPEFFAGPLNGDDNPLLSETKNFVLSQIEL